MNKLYMSTTPNSLTIKFNKQVETLIESGIVANYAEIVRDLDWNKSMMTTVTKGRKNVPMAVYRKFTDRYSLNPPQETVEKGDKDKLIALLEDRVSFAEKELRHIAVMNFAILQVMRKSVAKILAKTEKTDILKVAETLDKETSAYYRSVRKKGSLLDFDI